ncbi:MAG TPA: hypothetical protein VFW87_15385 [Pirellulales bacterium]|nr:hypothetical protein [Pirellulales bacterium]
MRIRRGLLTLVISICAADRAVAQAPSVVQLPSFSFYTVDTTVSVPDRGTASLGGVGRSSTGSTAFGPGLGPPNRAFGRNLNSSSVSVRASIHDFEALDRATLDRATLDRATLDRAGSRDLHPRSSRPGSSSVRRLGAGPRTFAERDATLRADRVPLRSVAEARRLHAASAAADESEALADLEHARHAVAQGKPGVAKIYYKIALRQASSKLKPQINRELAALAK